MEKGWPGLFGSIDCMHYQWKNCPVAWNGQYLDKDGNISIILEAIVDQSLWIWHVFFGTAGSNNDLNVLQRSLLVKEILFREYDDISFDVNYRRYSKYYLLADGIYPKWSIFVQSIKDPQREKKNILPTNRKQLEKMWSGVLGCSKRDGQFYNNQVVCGVCTILRMW